MNFTDLLKKRMVFLDGAMGTLLQEAGLMAGENPEDWNITKPSLIEDIHFEYLSAGADVVYTNTFGATGIKLESEYELEDIVRSAVKNAKKAVTRAGKGFVALSLSSTGKLLKPLGDLGFEEAYESYREVVGIGSKAGADLIVVETMSDTYELKSAVLAAKESDLPVMATVAFDEKGKLLTGADPVAVIALLEGMKVDALGLNCGLDPRKAAPIIDEFLKYSSTPVAIKLNAGLPVQKDGKTVFDISPKEYGALIAQYAAKGVQLVGACCGSTPEHIRELVKACSSLPYVLPVRKNHTLISSYGPGLVVEDHTIIGERINPTGNKALRQSLAEGDFSYAVKEAIAQEEAGAHIIDVNAGLPGIDEKAVVCRLVSDIQRVTPLPLQIDSASADVIEAALRIYNGKAMVNSVNGKEESMERIFPTVAKYGGVVVALTLDEDGIPDDAAGRFLIAKKIVERAKSFGISKKDIVIDPLCMTISAVPTAMKETLAAVKMIKKELGVKTILGVSNISFGLPRRDIINANFYAKALHEGLDFSIINPLSESMRATYNAYRVLSGDKDGLNEYIEIYGSSAALKTGSKPAQSAKTSGAAKSKTAPTSLRECVLKGLISEAAKAAEELLATMTAMDIINTELVPALDEVGEGFEKGSVFLPQLMMSAETAAAAFEILKKTLPAAEDAGKGPVVIATVKGDIHDIGKNIVKVLLENYGFKVVDLGKDVNPEEVARVCVEKEAKLLGLSALMTTTVENMARTIEIVRRKSPATSIMVGGAVLNAKYAKSIDADRYCKDAMESVRYALEIFA
ncbi:MAG: dihydropteroate synthase [Clostridiales bacterium]|nr:dihydropteroate synthase [Clostridiales bacterium]